MMYITGKFALNLECSLDTCGDWHTSSLNWSKLTLNNSDKSIFKDYGIEECHKVPEHDGTFYIANTLRALLDLLEQNKLWDAEGAKEDFICNDRYTHEFFNKVIMLTHSEHWDDINEFMRKEYKMQWIKFLEDTKNVQ